MEEVVTNDNMRKANNCLLTLCGPISTVLARIRAQEPSHA